jgi:hypothetical protein
MKLSKTLALAVFLAGATAIVAAPGKEQKDCMKKAKEAQTASLSACSSKTGQARKDCEKTANDVFRTAKAACKK